MKLNLTNFVYDLLKNLAQVILPGAGTLYFAIAAIWSLPAAEQVVGTITAVDAFLGVVLSVLSKGYTAPADGHLTVDTSDPAKDTYSLELHTPLDELASKDSVKLNIKQFESFPPHRT